MYRGSSTKQLLSFQKTFSGPESENLIKRLDEFNPGEYQRDFETHFHYVFKGTFTPLIEKSGISVAVCDDGLKVNETIFWQGVSYRDAVNNQLIPLKFNQSFKFPSSHFIDLYEQSLYPIEYKLPRRLELTQAVALLLIAHLNSSMTLYFLVKNEAFLKESLSLVYQAMGPHPIHAGVLKKMASEPPNYRQFDSQHLSWDKIKEQSHKTHKDITRSPHLTIRAGRQHWEIQEDKKGVEKEQVFQQAMSSLQGMNTLPRVVLDALQLGAHQSGFLNEAVIAAGVYVNEMTDYSVTLPQSGIRRRLNFTVIDDHVEVTDHCEWHEVCAPLRSPGGSELDVRRVALSKPFTLHYRYELREGAGRRLFHQIKELKVEHESRIKKLAIS